MIESSQLKKVFNILFGVIFIFIFVCISIITVDIDELKSKDDIESITKLTKELDKLSTTKTVEVREKLKQLSITYSSGLFKIDEAGCESVLDDQLCENELKLLRNKTVNEILMIPVNDYHLVVFPENQYNKYVFKYFNKFSSIDKFLYLVERTLPFIILFLLWGGIYHYLEKVILNPLILKIADYESKRNIFQNSSKVAHDLQAPLTAIEQIVGHIEDSDLSELLKMSSDRIKTIVETQLEESKKSLSNTIIVDFTDITKKLLSEFEFRNNEIEFVLDSKLSNLYYIERSNLVNFERSVSNLIENSIDSFSNYKGVITVKLYAGVEGIECSIVDNGSGMECSLIDKVLEYGASTKVNGNGIGLSSVKDWINKIGGKFKIESELGVGTCIELLIPCSRV